MNIVNDWPPNKEQILARFPVEGVCVYLTYGDTIYNPTGGEIPEDFIVHEQVHIEQQKAYGGPEKWWNSYISDWLFRIQQEAPAYGAQIAFIRRKNGRAVAEKRLNEFVKYLKSPIYDCPLHALEIRRMLFRESL